MEFLLRNVAVSNYSYLFTRISCGAHATLLHMFRTVQSNLYLVIAYLLWHVIANQIAGRWQKINLKVIFLSKYLAFILILMFLDLIFMHLCLFLSMKGGFVILCPLIHNHTLSSFTNLFFWVNKWSSLNIGSQKWGRNREVTVFSLQLTFTHEKMALSVAQSAIPSLSCDWIISFLLNDCPERCPSS